MLQRGCHFSIGYSPFNHQLSHTRIDTAFSPGKYPRHGCSLWIYPPTHWVYTRITPFALFIYEDSNHINLGMGHGINTGTHMCICGSACHSCFLALTDTTNCFPLTASGGRSKKYHSIDSPAIKTGCTHIWPDSGYVHYLHGWGSVFCLRVNFLYACNIFITRPEWHQKFNPLNLGI